MCVCVYIYMYVCVCVCVGGASGDNSSEESVAR